MVAVGSSTTLGTGASSADSGWVSLLKQYYKCRMGIIDTVLNFGLTGANFYMAMPNNYIPPPLRPYPDAAHNISKAVANLSDLTNPSHGVIIVNFPSNSYISYSFSEILNGLQVIYDSATATGNLCFITTTQPRNDAAFNNPLAKRKLADIKDSIINRFGTDHSINFWDGMFNPSDTSISAQYSCGDLVHFNNTGHRALFERVLAKNIFGLPVWYSKTTGNLDELATWGCNPDGTGNYPVSFSQDNQTFYIVNNPTPTIGANWILSGKNTKLVTGDSINPVHFNIPEGLSVTVSSPAATGCN